MSLKLNHVHLKTKDPEKTAKFYVDTLGAKIVGQAGNGGYRLDLHGLSLNVTNFIESQTREQKYGMEHIAIDTDELDTLVEGMLLRGTGWGAARVHRDEGLALDGSRLCVCPPMEEGGV
jgi:catechol 2,3-dioxygenase-like lactoylglutathione lyase family enzyme